jgi:hypothetical protein
MLRGVNILELKAYFDKLYLAITGAFDSIAPTTTTGDLIVYGDGENDRLAVGRQGQVIMADPAQSLGMGYGEAVDPRYKTVFYDDFTNYYSQSYAGNTGTGSSYSGGTALGNPGTLTLTTGTTTTGGAIVGQCGQNRYINTTRQIIFEVCVWIPTLATVSADFLAYVGFNDRGTTINGNYPANGAYFVYYRGANGDVWACHTGSASTRTITVTASAINTGGWTRLTIINTNGSVEFQIDGTTVATHTTNIPTAACSFSAYIVNSGTTTSRSMYLDYLYCSEELNR